ncbi:unnamed protein product [marine sediment metagenome]|uniref:Uncharacterized protein n=1 Tax=marine sediment metagenome TaxID=412755 RepID=X1IVP6_9ZZZZ
MLTLSDLSQFIATPVKLGLLCHGPAYPIKELKFSDSTFILTSPVKANDHLTVGEFVDIGIVIPYVPGWSFIEKWLDETMEVYAKICIPYHDKFELPNPSIREYKLIPDCEANLTSERDSQLFLCYNAVITVTGFIERKNYCHAGGHITCRFIGPGIVRETTPPDRAPDIEEIIPCNSRPEID